MKVAWPVGTKWRAVDPWEWKTRASVWLATRLFEGTDHEQEIWKWRCGGKAGWERTRAYATYRAWAALMYFKMGRYSFLRFRRKPWIPSIRLRRSRRIG